MSHDGAPHDGAPHDGVLTVACPDVPGIVYAVSGFLVTRGATILESQQFGDPQTGRFFLRVRFGAAAGGRLDLDGMRGEFAAVAQPFAMTWQMVDTRARPRVLILVSKFAHCLNELLFRNSVGDLHVEVVAVVSNHPDLAHLAESYGVPFRHVPVTPATKADAEAVLLQIVRDEHVDLVVLARYMQILSEDLCTRLEGRAINIHHSALPSFKGARPYRQAHARGVKVIGATAHYVTPELDEGPIVEQEVARVDHSMSEEEFVARGRGIEARVLARAVAWHTENRVLLNGTKTVVLR